MRRESLVALIGMILLCSPHPGVAQVYQWEYVDPANPSLGKQQSSMLAPDGATADLSSPIGLGGRDLTMAYLAGANLRQYRVGSTILNNAYLEGADLYNLQGDRLVAQGADFSHTDLQVARLENANLSGSSFVGADLSSGHLSYANLTGADLTDANVYGSEFVATVSQGLTPQQLYSTASYQNGDLGPISLNGDLTNWDLSGVNMNGARFIGSNFQNANLTNAHIASGTFTNSNLAASQLYATASYQAANLGRIDLSGVDLSGWDFSGVAMKIARLENSDLTDVIFDNADLSRATLGRRNVEIVGTSFRNAQLAGADFETSGRWRNIDFTGANLEGADLTSNFFVDSTFEDAVVRGAEIGGITLENLYSTASYKDGDLRDVDLSNNDLAGADFQGVDLSGARLNAHMDGANFARIVAIGSYFGSARVSDDSIDNATFDAATLRQSTFSFKSTAGISFRKADLSHAHFEVGTMEGVDLADATIYGTSFDAPVSELNLKAQQLYSTASYKAGNLGPIQIEGDLRAWDFRNQDLTGARFGRDSQLDGAMWDGATLTSVTFFVNSLPDADFRHAAVDQAVFESSDLERGNFRGVNLHRSRISGSSAVDGDFENATWTSGSSSHSDFTRSSFVNADLRGTAFFSVDFSDADFTNADIRGASFDYPDNNSLTLLQIKSSASYASRDLSNVQFEGFDMPGEDFTGFQMSGFEFGSGILAQGNFTGAGLSRAYFYGADLTMATFENADLTGARFAQNEGMGTVNLSNAKIRGASFVGLTNRGFVAGQLYATQTYQEGALGPIDLSSNNLTGWDFRGQDLQGARFASTTLNEVRFDLADLRGGYLPTDSRTGALITGTAVLNRAILPDGRIRLLQVNAGETFVLRNAPQPADGATSLHRVQVIEGVEFDPAAKLQIILDSQEWRSTLVADQIPIQLGGVLDLQFGPGVDSFEQVGRTFHLFEWTSADVNGQFQISSDPRYVWDLTELYSGGAVTLVGVVPEPSAIALAFILTASLVKVRKRTATWKQRVW